MRPIKATWTREMVDEFKYFGIFEYKFKNKEEQKIVEKYFDVEYVEKDKIYYSINNKIIRKLKLFKISGNEIYEILQKIRDNSTVANASDILSWKLSEELAKEIDKEILRKLMKLKS